MTNNNGKLCWGPCINTTGNRMCEPQGQFNGEGSEFETSTYAHLVNLEHDRAHAGSFLMTVPLDQIIDLCAFHGDLDKIAGYLCQKDVDKERAEIYEDPPELPPRPMRGSCSPVKDGENAEEKLIAETIKKAHHHLRAMEITSEGMDQKSRASPNWQFGCGPKGRQTAQPVGGA